MTIFKKRFLLWFIIGLSALAIYIDLPNMPLKIHIGALNVAIPLSHPAIDWQMGSIRFKRDLEPKLGLDLQGGTHLVLSADMKDIPADKRASALESAKAVIERRVNLYGVSEPLIQTSKVGDEYRIIVELAGVNNVTEAKDLVGQTSKLEFRELIDASSSAVPTLSNTKSTDVGGKDLADADTVFSQTTNTPQVSFKMKGDGIAKFAQLTKRLQGKPLAIFLDDKLLTAPTVQNPILDGEGVITGSSDVAEAKRLAINLKAGALPVPVKIIGENTVSATLGTESIQKSLFAGLIGILTVGVFMLIYYGWFGVVAVVALLIYSLLNVMLFKLFPITITLAGIAGFILSVGMAVDANILTFERVKEELRSGQRMTIALEVGFKRAWNSIRDSNISSLITAGILFWLGTGSVKGFALTLIVGILTSMFTAVVVSRTILRVFRGNRG